MCVYACVRYSSFAYEMCGCVRVGERECVCVNMSTLVGVCVFAHKYQFCSIKL